MADSTETDPPPGVTEEERVRAERRKDLCLVVLVVLVKFGDAVEIYLPGVITQQTSCELNVNGTEEAMLGIIMYLSQAISTIMAQTISKYLSQRTVVMVSLYVSIIATIMCAVVHNYITLLLSRMFVGFCIGLNNSNINVLFNQAVSNRKTADWGLYLVNFGFAFGSGWVSILGYIFLKMLGWRNFVLLVSIPWFIPPILMFHFYLTPQFLQSAKEANEKQARESGTATTLPDPDDIPTAAEIWGDSTTRNRIFKIGGLNFLLSVHGCGTILLMPSLFRAANVADSISEDDRCAGVIGGTQFLIMAAISGGINSLAKLPAFYLPRWVKFKVLMTFLGTLITLSYAVMMAWDFTHPAPDMWVIVITISVITFAWSIMLNEAICCIHDHDIFRPAIESHTSALIWGLVAFGITAGNALASFMDPVTAVQANFGISFIEIVLILLTHERVSNKKKHTAKLAAKQTKAEFKAVKGGEAVMISNPAATDTDLEQ